MGKRDGSRYRRRRLLRLLLLQVLYTVRSERMLMEQLAYNLLFRWFMGLSASEGYGTQRYSARTGIGFWKELLP